MSRSRSKTSGLSLIAGLLLILVGSSVPALADDAASGTTAAPAGRSSDAPAGAAAGPDDYDETRGQIIPGASLCDAVDPPDCPKGCKEDKENGICVNDDQ